MSKDLLNKFLENRCSPTELEEMLQWIDKNALSDDGKQIALDDWKSSFLKEHSLDNDERFGVLLDKIHHQINIKQFKEPMINRPENYSGILRWMTRAAAILLIPVLSILIYVLSSDVLYTSKIADMQVDSLEVIAPPGSRTIVQLSDGTNVHLNSGSKIKYPKNFNKNNREVSLSGEGFFDVFHDPKHPFVVKSKQINIKALGTKFNVLSYNDNDLVETTLLEGKVVLEKLSGKSKLIGALVPGQHVEYHIKTGEISSTNDKVDKYVAWKDGLLLFDNSNMEDVAERLERMFNVEIETTSEIKDFTYTVKFAEESLSQILELLSKATPITYEFMPRKKLPDGTYSKQKIRIKRAS